MKLKVLLPSEIMLDVEVAKVIAEAANGSFGLLPRHIDFVAALVPGLLSYETPEGEELFVAVDEGILVKRGQDVLVSTRNAVSGPDLGKLRQTIEQEFLMHDERERTARSALANLEADFVRRFVELKV